MGIFGLYRDASGKVCPVYLPRDLHEVELNHMAECQEDETMTTEISRIVYDHGGFEEMPDGELARKIASRRLDAFAQDHMRRHPGCSYGEAFRVAQALYPEVFRTYCGAPSARDHERATADAAAVIVEGPTARYYVHRYDVPAAPSDWGTFIVPAGVTIEIGYPIGRAIWTPIRAEFDPAAWSITGAEGWLRSVGLEAKILHVDREGPRDRVVPGGQPRPVRYWALVSDETFENFPRRTLRG